MLAKGVLGWYCHPLHSDHLCRWLFEHLGSLLLTEFVSDGRGKNYESILVAKFIHAYVSEEYGETTETNKTNKHKQLGSKGLIQTINIVIYTLSVSNDQTPLWLPMA